MPGMSADPRPWDRRADAGASLRGLHDGGGLGVVPGWALIPDPAATAEERVGEVRDAVRPDAVRLGDHPLLFGLRHRLAAGSTRQVTGFRRGRVGGPANADPVDHDRGAAGGGLNRESSCALPCYGRT